MTYAMIRRMYAENAKALARDGDTAKADTYRRLSTATDDELRQHLIETRRRMRTRLIDLRRES